MTVASRGCCTRPTGESVHGLDQHRATQAMSSDYVSRQGHERIKKSSKH